MPTADPERSAVESARRAVRRIREIVYDYDLRLLWTLTFAENPGSYEEVAAAAKRFSRKLRDSGFVGPRIVVPELSDEQRWHLHVAVGDYIPITTMRHLWPLGHVWPPNHTIAESPGALDQISWYLSKTFLHDQPRGERRYFPSAGLNPLTETFLVPTYEAALDLASERLLGNVQWMRWYGGLLVAGFEGGHADGSSQPYSSSLTSLTNFNM